MGIKFPKFFWDSAANCWNKFLSGICYF